MYMYRTRKIILLSLLGAVLLAAFIFLLTFRWETKINESFVATEYGSYHPNTVQITITGTRVNRICGKDYYSSLKIKVDKTKHNLTKEDRCTIKRANGYEYVGYEDHGGFEVWNNDNVGLWMDQDEGWFLIRSMNRYYVYSKNEDLDHDYIMGRI